MSLPPRFIENVGQWNNDILFTITQSSVYKTIVTPKEFITYVHTPVLKSVVKKTDNELSDKDVMTYTIGYNFGSFIRDVSNSEFINNNTHYLINRKTFQNVRSYRNVGFNLENDVNVRLQVNEKNQVQYIVEATKSELLSFFIDGLTALMVKDNIVRGKSPIGNFSVEITELFSVNDNKEIPIDFQVIVSNDGKVTVHTTDDSEKTKVKMVLMQPTFSNLLSGSNDDEARCVDVDSSKSIYVAGESNSQDFPTTPGVFQSSLVSSRDCFVAKYNADGSNLIFSTFIGGDGIDRSLDISVSDQGKIYLAGSSSSNNFPVSPNAFQSKRKNLDQGSDAFVLILSSDGKKLEASTYFGGQFNDAAETVDFDRNGNVYISGKTDGPKEFPIGKGFQTQFGGGSSDGYVAKLSPDLSKTEYSSFLGGELDDYPYALTVNDSGSVFVVGQTQSKKFPITPFTVSNKFAGGNYDSFITKISPDGQSLRYSTLVGGTGDESASGVVVDIYDNAYVVGNTNSKDFPRTVLGADTSFNGSEDAFCYKISKTADRFFFSTLVGGSNEDYAKSVNIDPCYAVYISGVTNSNNLPISDDPIQKDYSGSYDAFLTKINAEGNLFVYGTYLGGVSDDQSLGAVVDSSGAVTLVGYTTSSNFPTSSQQKGRKEAFITKIQVGILPLSPKITADGPLSFCAENGNVTLDVGAGYRTYQWKKDNQLINGANAPRITVNESGEYTIEVVDLSGCIGLNSVTVRAFLPPKIDLRKKRVICPDSSTKLTLISKDSLVKFRWFPTLGLSADTVREPIANPPVSTLYTVLVSDTNGCSARDSVWVYVVDPNGIGFSSIPDTLEVCPSDSLAIALTIKNKDIIPRRLTLTSNSSRFRVLKKEIVVEAGADSIAAISFDGSSSAGTYSDRITITDTCGNTKDAQLFVRVGTPLLKLEPDADTTICANEPTLRKVRVKNSGAIGTTVRLKTNNNLFIIPVDSLSVKRNDSVSFDVRFVGANPGIYTATLHSVNGCGADDSVQVKIVVEGNPLAFAFTGATGFNKVGETSTIDITVSNTTILDTARNRTLSMTIAHEKTSLEAMNVRSSNCDVVFSVTDSTTTINLTNCRAGITNPIAQIEYKILVGQTLSPQLSFSSIVAGDRCIDPQISDGVVRILPFGCEVKTLNVSMFGSELRSISPNPVVNGTVTVEFSSVEEIPTTIRILDIIGREVLSIDKASTEPGVFSMNIPTQHLPEGLYLMVFEAGAYRSSMPIAIK